IPERQKNVSKAASGDHRNNRMCQRFRKSRPWRIFTDFRHRRAATTEMTNSTLTPKPKPDHSSIGNSPTAWNPFSKLASRRVTICEGKSSKKKLFHRSTQGKIVGAKLPMRIANELPRRPTSG